MSDYPNGIYKIFANPIGTPGPVGLPKTFVTIRTALGNLTGVLEKDSFDKKRVLWKLTNLGDGKVIFESVAYPGTYASVYVQDSGAALIGLPNPTIWKFVKREAIHLPGFRITPLSGSTSWFLPDSESKPADVSISLEGPHTSLQGSAIWALEPGA